MFCSAIRKCPVCCSHCTHRGFKTSVRGHWRVSGVEDSPTKLFFPLQGTVVLHWTLALDGCGKLEQLERLNILIAV